MNKLSRLSNGCGKLVTSLPVQVIFCKANCPLVFIKAISAVERKGHANQGGTLYSTANDPQPQMIPRPQMIPKMDRKWSSTASDPQIRPQMIPKEK